MKKFYVVDPDGTIKSLDGTKTYKVLKGKALKEFLSSEEGKQRRFDICKDARGNCIGVELPPSMYKQHRKEENRKRYLAEMRKELDISEISIERKLLGDEEGNGEEILADDTVDLDNFIIRGEEKIILEKALAELSFEEKQIIYGIFYENLTERALAEKLGLKKTYVHTQKLKILEKLKTFF